MKLSQNGNRLKKRLIILEVTRVGIAITAMEVQKKKATLTMSTDMFVKHIEGADITCDVPILKCEMPNAAEWQEVKRQCIEWATFAKKNEPTEKKVCSFYIYVLNTD
jgi:hypothetical protein